ncbi:hypothetical protein QQ045_027963 [Rhodiola kirilowii]
MYLKIFNPFVDLILLSIALFATVYGHIDTPCQHLVVHDFTPCFNLVTGSSANGSSSTAECCSELNKLSHNDIDCACLVILGTIPAQLTFLRSLQAVLPRSCNVSGVPLQCNRYGAPLPAPGSSLIALARVHSPAPSPKEPDPPALPTTPVRAETPRPTGQQIQPVLNPASDAPPAAVFKLWCLTAIMSGMLTY